MYAEQRERIKRVSGVHLSVDGHYQFSKPMGIYSSEIKDGKEVMVWCPVKHVTLLTIMDENKKILKHEFIPTEKQEHIIAMMQEIITYKYELNLPPVVSLGVDNPHVHVNLPEKLSQVSQRLRGFGEDAFEDSVWAECERITILYDLFHMRKKLEDGVIRSHPNRGEVYRRIGKIIGGFSDGSYLNNVCNIVLLVFVHHLINYFLYLLSHYHHVTNM